MNEQKKYKVLLTKKVQKSLRKIPQRIRDKFALLALQLSENGPVASNWLNYSKLSGTHYHCHIDVHWVACWSYEKGQIIIEVYYVGSRENAPY